MITCVSCGSVFGFTGYDRLFYLQHGLSYPTHCAPCRKMRKLFPPMNLIATELPFSIDPCVCPRCGIIYRNTVDVKYSVSADAWRVERYLVVLCDECVVRKFNTQSIRSLIVSADPQNKRTVRLFTGIGEYSLTKAIDGYWETEKIGVWTFSECVDNLPTPAYPNSGTVVPVVELPVARITTSRSDYPQCARCYDVCPTDACFKDAINYMNAIDKSKASCILMRERGTKNEHNERTNS